jgi:hypothetical protein
MKNILLVRRQLLILRPKRYGGVVVVVTDCRHGIFAFELDNPLHFFYPSAGENKTQADY